MEQDSSASALVRVYLLGPLEICKQDSSGTWKLVTKEQWKNSKPARSVFKRLLVQPGRRLSRNTLEDDLWAETDNFELAAKNVYNSISLIRGIIGKSLVTCWDAAYEIADQTQVWTDFAACDALLKAAENQGHTSPQTLSLLESARALLERGALLEGEDGKWGYAFRKRAEDMLRQVRLWLAENYERQGKLWQAGEQYRTMVLTDPSDEEALHHWISMLYQQGKTQEALKCYQEMKEFVETQGFPVSNELEQVIASLSGQPYWALFAPPLGVQRKLDSDQTKNMDIIRRQLLQGILGIAGVPLFSGGTSQISTDMLPLFATLTDICRQLSQGDELSIAEKILCTYLPKVELLARLSSDSQEEAANIAAQGYLLAASLVGHRDDLLGRLHYSEQALRFGELANDLNLQVVAMRQIAISFDYLGYPDHVLHSYQRALPHLNEVSPLLRACIYADMSGTYTQIKQEKEAKHFLQMACEQFPAHQENEPAFLSTICRYATLILCEGLHHLSFGRPHEAERVFAQIDGIHPKVFLPERIRLDLLNCQAETFFVLGDLEQACTYLETSIHTSMAIGSERRLKEAFVLFQQMQQKWQKEPYLVKLQSIFSQHFVNGAQ